jgi:transcriptional regulator GlxA family with amidase domain
MLNILDELSVAKQTRSLASEAYAIPLQRSTSPRITNILETIHRDFQRPLRQNDLARAADLSRAAFNRNFRQATGTTLIDYVNDLRIGHACRMLAESSKPITEICFESGFTNLSNFNRCFLRRRGMPPSRFRSQFRR